MRYELVIAHFAQALARSPFAAANSVGRRRCGANRLSGLNGRFDTRNLAHLTNRGQGHDLVSALGILSDVIHHIGPDLAFPNRAKRGRSNDSRKIGTHDGLSKVGILLLRFAQPRFEFRIEALLHGRLLHRLLLLALLLIESLLLRFKPFSNKTLSLELGLRLRERFQIVKLLKFRGRLVAFCFAQPRLVSLCLLSPVGDLLSGPFLCFVVSTG